MISLPLRTPRPVHNSLPFAPVMFALVLLTLIASGAVGATVAHAQAPPGELVAVVSPDSSSGQHQDASSVEIMAVDVTDETAAEIPSRRVVKIRTLRPLKNFWDAHLSAPTMSPVHRGQTGLLTFWARTVEVPGVPQGQGRVAAYFQRSAEPWDKSFVVKRHIPRRWTLFQIPFRVHESFSSAEAQICLGFGFEPQEVEVAEVSVQVYPSSIELDSLPSTPEPGPEDSMLP